MYQTDLHIGTKLDSFRVCSDALSCEVLMKSSAFQRMMTNALDVGKLRRESASYQDIFISRQGKEVDLALLAHLKWDKTRTCL